jgi:hypothetical protein
MNKFLMLAFLLVTTLLWSQTSSAAPPGMTDTVFNKRLLPDIKPMLTYNQIVAIAGAPGIKTGQSANTSPSTVQYIWKGGKKSMLTARFADNKMIDATILVPNGKTFAIRSSGKIEDLGYK